MNLRACIAVMLVLVGVGVPAWAADEKPAAKEAKPGAAKKSPADYRGPLPAYYNKVLSPDEKEKLYAITEKYAPQIKELQGKLKELEAARDRYR